MLEKRQRLIAMARQWDGLAGKVSPPMLLKRQVTLETLLRWTYFDELPKGEIQRAKPLREFKEGWASIANFGDYIEGRSSNLWGSFQRFNRGVEPHQDALTVARAVDRLDLQILELPDDLNPFSDFSDSGLESEKLKAQVFSSVKVCTPQGRMKLRFKPSALVFNYTILGGCPAWQTHTTGTGSLKDLSKGQALALGLARAEYEIWHLALDLLAKSLATKLVKHELLTSLTPARPWETTAFPKKRILPVLHEAL